MNRVPVALQRRSGTFRPPTLQTLPVAVTAKRGRASCADSEHDHGRGQSRRLRPRRRHGRQSCRCRRCRVARDDECRGGFCLRAARLAVPILTWLHPSGIDAGAAAATRVDVAVGSVDELGVQRILRRRADHRPRRDVEARSGCARVAGHRFPGGGIERDRTCRRRLPCGPRPVRRGWDPRGVVRPRAQADGRLGPARRSAGHGKGATKLVAEAVGTSTSPGRLVAAADIAGIGFETDVVVKPASTGSSFGVALARDAFQLRDALRCAARFDDRILIEDVVPGREIDVAVLREADGCRWASPPREVQSDGLFDTRSKYDGSARFSVPADIDGADRAALTGRSCGCSTRSAAPVSPASTSS